MSWDTVDAVNHKGVTLGSISKADVETRSELTFDWTMQYLLTENFTEPSSPSTIVTENGSIGMLLLMRDTRTTEPLGFYFTRRDGETWTAPVRLTDIYEIRVKNNYLLRLNETHLIAIWMENYNATHPSVNFSLVYRLSSDNGNTWGQKERIFENCTNHFNAFVRKDGKIIFSMLFERAYRSDIIPFIEYYFEVPSDIKTLNASTPFRATPSDGENLPFYLGILENGDIILARGEGITITYTSKGEVSDTYRVLETVPYGIVGLHVIGVNTAICFITTANHQCGFKYLDNFYLTKPNSLSPELIFVIIVLVIIGAQITLYMLNKIHKRKKQRNPTQQENDGNTGKP
ncbi:MAG: hypothetical protein Q6373_017490 [Candidatus Sigynarchaeota archaeon]